jgi:hypothetical protein
LQNEMAQDSSSGHVESNDGELPRLSFDSEDDDENFWSSSLPTRILSVMIVQQISLYKSVDYSEVGIVAHTLHHWPLGRMWLKRWQNYVKSVPR